MKLKNLLILVVTSLSLTACSLNTLTFGLLGKEKSQVASTTAQQSNLPKATSSVIAEQQSHNQKQSQSAVVQTHQVAKDETLYSIARRYHVNLDELKENNNIGSDNLISVGQILVIHKTTVTTETMAQQQPATPSSSPITDDEPTVSAPPQQQTTQGASVNNDPLPAATWVWPMDGEVVRQFNPKGIGTNGIRISGYEGQTVHAAQDGVVVYRGRGLNGYGTIVILSHNDGLLSTYGFLSETHVQEGQRVFKRETIGTVGYASNKKYVLYFEVREKGDPINPMIQIGNIYRF